MEEQIRLVKDYLSGIWLSKKYILIFAWIICPLGWLSVSMIPNQYTSKAVVYADTQSILKPLLRGLTIYTDPSQKLRLVANTLLNTTNLETIGNEVDANIRANTKAEYDDLIQELKNGIAIDSGVRNNLYTISFKGMDPNYVRNVVQSTLNVFIESILGDKRTDSEEAQDVISDQIAYYESRLIDAEKKLADFKRENIGLMPDSGNNYYSSLVQYKNILEVDELNLKETESRIDKVEQQIRELTTLSINQIENFATEYDQRINAIKIRLDELLFRFTDKHPDVIETKRQLQEVNQLKNAYLQKIQPEELVQDNPIYRSLKINLNELNNEHASIEVKIEKHKSKIIELQDKLDYIPEVEAMLKSLNRDYGITKKKYEELLARGETATISSSIDSVSENIKFRIIESPNLPTSPSGPNRTFYYIFILFIGLGAGIGVALLISLVRPVVSSIKQIESCIGIPVVGVVSATEKSGFLVREKRKNVMFASLLLLLILLFFFMIFQGELIEFHIKNFIEILKLI